MVQFLQDEQKSGNPSLSKEECLELHELRTAYAQLKSKQLKLEEKAAIEAEKANNKGKAKKEHKAEESESSSSDSEVSYNFPN